MDENLDGLFTRIEALASGRDLPEIVRSTSSGTPALNVRENTFAQLLDARTLLLQCPVDQKTLLLDISPEIYFETDAYVGKAAVLVRLEEIGDEELALRLEDAWRFKAPPSLNRQRPTHAPI